jgi:hypothetical protein
LALAEDEGAVDYAKAYWHAAQSCVPFVRRYESVCGGNFAHDGQATSDKGDQLDYGASPASGFEIKGSIDKRAKHNVCGALSPAEQPQVREGDIITVNLQQAYIHEVAPSLVRRVLGKESVAAAIVARVAELDSGTDFDFSRAGLTRGRVVYYSSDIQAKQFLNFSRLPIYGPIEYKGKPLAVELYIVQLNVGDQKEFGSLLNSLAGVGSIAYAPASPVLKVLEEVGSALLKKTDVSDTQMRYSMTLVPHGFGLKMLRDGVLEYGNYVVSRLPRKATEGGTGSVSIWGDKYLSQKLGRVFADPACNDYVQHTYLTLQINRAKAELALDTANTFSRLVDQISNEAGIKAAARGALIQAAGNAMAARAYFQDSRSLVDAALETRWSTRARAGEAATPAPLQPVMKAKLDVLIDEIGRSLTKPEQQNAKFDAREAGILLDRLMALAPAAQRAKLSAAPLDVQNLKQAVGALD